MWTGPMNPVPMTPARSWCNGMLMRGNSTTMSRRRKERRSGSNRKRLRSAAAHLVGHLYLDRHDVADDVGAAMRVALHRLDAAARVHCPRQDGATAWLRGCAPVVFPKAPRVGHRIAEEIRRVPRRAAVGANLHLGDICLAGPRGAVDAID